MRKIHIITGILLALAMTICAHVHGQTIFNCSSFNSGTGTCGANTSSGPFKMRSNYSPTVTGSHQIQLAPANTSHAALAVTFTTPVNVQAFSTTYTFVPSGNILAFVLQNTNNQPGYQGIDFVAGAGCEGGFFQASNVGVGGQSPNNVFAITMDGWNNLDPNVWGPGPNGFTYSGTALYHAGQDPCKPNDGDPVYSPVNNISTSPVSLNTPANTPATTTGHTYSVTITYDGSNVTESLFDVTAGGSCPGPSCFTHTWSGVNIPAIVGGSNTALAGITASTVATNIYAPTANPAPVVINSWSYTAGAPASPVTITANVPSSPSIVNDALLVMPGSTRQINVQIANGTLNTVNWSAVASGGATATFTDPTHSAVSSISGALPTIQVNFGGTAAACTQTPAAGVAGPYTLSGGTTVTVTAQSVDDTSKTATFNFKVCSLPPATLLNGTSSVIVAPAYDQAYKSQPVTLQSWVVGCPDESGTWSIIAQPGGGDGALVDTNKRDTLFSATVTGRYFVRYTAACNGGTGTAIVYVSPNSMPSYAVTPNLTRPHECYVDPALTGADYEIGSGKTYATIGATPAIAGITAGSIYRLWNTDNTGLAPSTFNEYFQIKNSGNPTQPIVFCGVPDSLGNLPIMDGANATGQSGISTGAAAGLGVLSIWGGPPTPYGGWQSGSAGPSYVGVWGLHLRNATPAFNYTPPGGGAPVAWQIGASCANLRGGAYLNVSGNDLDTCTNGIFTAENGNSLWANITQNVTVTGNHIQHSGWAGDFTEHQAYLQSWYLLFEGNKLDNYLNTASGSNVKWRGVEGIFRYNYLSGGPSRDFDLVDNQDAGAWVSLESYFTNVYPYGDNLGANGVAWYQESAQRDFVYGNVVYAGANLLNQIHYAEDHEAGMANRNGTLYAYANTLPDAKVVFDTRSGGNGYNGFYQPRVWFANNIFWAANLSGVGSALAVQSATPVILTGLTNLFANGSMSITLPITGGSYNAGTAIGWQSGCDVALCPWPLSSPLNTHIYSLTSGNYISTAVLPYDPTTLIPGSGSVAVGRGTALTGAAALLPLRWNYGVTTGALTARTQPLTLGAEDAVTPTAATPTFSPAAGTYPSALSVTISDTTPAATIYYTTDGSTPTTGSAVYSGPITVSVTTTVKAIAASSGYNNSGVGSALYTIGIPVAATPVITPTAGTYTSIQTISISDSTPSSTIYYTVDGSTPTTGSPVYSGSFTINNNTTVKALAAASGYTNSAVASSAFTINLAGLWNSLAGWQTCILPGCDPGGTGTPVSTDLTIRNASPSLSGSSMQMSMVVNTNDTNALWTWFAADCDLCTNFSSDFQVYLPSTTNLGALELDTAFLFSTGLNREYMWGWQYCYTGASCPGGRNSWDAWDQSTITWVDTGVTQAPVIGWNHVQTTNHRSGNSQIYDTFILNGTTHNLNITQNSSVLPMGWTSGTGFQFQLDAASHTGTQTFSINLDSATFSASTAPTAGTPTFSPVAGTYTGTQSVTISTTSGGVICYNTTGAPATNSTTGCSAGTLYTGPVSVASSETLYAVAGGTGFVDSSVGSAAYVINAPSPVRVILQGTQSFLGNATLQ